MELNNSFFDEDCPGMLRDVEAWSRKSAQIDVGIMQEYTKMPRRVWMLLSESFPHLGRLMVWIYSICVTNATLERVFSSMGWQYAPRRKRLGQKTVDKMTSICYRNKADKIVKKRTNQYPDSTVTTSTMIPEMIDEATEMDNQAIENEDQEDPISGSFFIDRLNAQGDDEDDPRAIACPTEIKISLSQLFIRIDTTRTQLDARMQELESLLLN